ncbi:MAG: hypothetical protein ABSH56_26870 [Bryobacteraceae bacterium]
MIRTSRAVALALAAAASAAGVADTPPMGWNSWDAYGTTVTRTPQRCCW